MSKKRFAYCQKIDTPEYFIVLFFHQKTCKSLFKEVKPSPNLHKMIKVLMFDVLLPPVYITFWQKLMLKQYSVLRKLVLVVVLV